MQKNGGSIYGPTVAHQHEEALFSEDSAGMEQNEITVGTVKQKELC